MEANAGVASCRCNARFCCNRNWHYENCEGSNQDGCYLYRACTDLWRPAGMGSWWYDGRNERTGKTFRGDSHQTDRWWIFRKHPVQDTYPKLWLAGLVIQWREKRQPWTGKTSGRHWDSAYRRSGKTLRCCISCALSDLWLDGLGEERCHGWNERTGKTIRGHRD